MVLSNRSLILLSEMVNNQRGVFFASLLEREERKTKEGKPYFRVLFSGANRQVGAVLWGDSPLFAECRDTWKIGTLYKIDAAYSVTKYGPQLQIFRIREAREKDFEEGGVLRFAFPAPTVKPDILYDKIVSLAKEKITKGAPLQRLVLRIYKEYREPLLSTPSSRGNHHAYPGGLLEHTLSVTQIAVRLAEHFLQAYPQTAPALSLDLVAAGAMLHEIGKIEEMDPASRIPIHTVAGDLVGYPVLGRDVVRRHASDAEVSPDELLRLEHILLTHPRFNEWGAVKPPASFEALLVHQADYADSVFAAAARILDADAGTAPFTASNGPFGVPWFNPSGRAPEPPRSESTCPRRDN